MRELTRYRNHHLTDRDLLLAIDGELPPARRASAAAHLADCAECRNRQARIDRAAAGYGALYCDAPRSEHPHGDPARARLRSRLNDATVQWRGGWSGRILDRVAASPWVITGVVATAAALVFVMANPSLSNRRCIAAVDVSAVDSDALPVASLTPGATWNVSLGQLCAAVAREQRQVPASVRQQVLRDYGMENVPREEYELDYLITPELGGAPHPRNLWPQRYTSPVWNAQVKDQLELLLPRMVCDRQVRLETAQRDIAVDWIAAYKKYFKTDAPIAARARLDDRDTGQLDDDTTYPVWRTTGAPILISFAVRR